MLLEPKLLTGSGLTKFGQRLLVSCDQVAVSLYGLASLEVDGA